MSINIKAYLKKWLPKRHELESVSGLKWMHFHLFNPLIWHFNRKTVSKGVAVGLFAALLPLPFQMLIAAILAIIICGNLPIALACTWVTNPFTFIPLNYFIYKVGQWVTGMNGSFRLTQDFSFQIHDWRSVGIHFLQWLQGLGKPFFVGLLIVAFSVALLAYVLVNVVWKISIYWRWRKKRR